MKKLLAAVCFLAIGLSSAVFAGNPGSGNLPYPGADPVQSPTQSPPYLPPIQAQEQSQKEDGVPPEIWVALIGVIGTIGAAFVGAYYQKRKSAK